MRRPIARLLLMLVVANLCAACGGWVGGEVEGSYYAVERGRLLHLVEVDAQETSTPFNPVIAVLVEPCASREQTGVDTGDLPCWPRERHRQRALLEQLATRSPDFRYKSVVLRAAENLNSKLGPWQRTWILGTKPLVVGFIRTRAQLAEDIRVSQSGEVTEVWLRDAHFVSDDDFDEQANVLLLFPEDLILAVERTPAPDFLNPGRQVKIRYFHEPRTVRWLMDALLDPERLQRESEQIAEISVRRMP